MATFQIEFNGGVFEVEAENEQIALQALQQGKNADGFSFLEMAQNIPSSAMQLAKDVVHPIIHPVETAKSLQTIGQGAVEKAIPNNINGIDFGQTVNENTLDQVGQFIADRYGSIDSFKKTIQEDPVGVLADASMILTAGGSAALKTGKVSKAAKATQTVGRSIDPINAALASIQGLRKSGSVIPASVPEKLLESAVKFRPSLKQSQRTRMVKTALKEGIMPSVSGLEKIAKKLDILDSELNKVIDTATKNGTLINKKVLFTKLKKLRQDVGGVKLDAGKDIKVIDDVAKQFDVQLKKHKKDKLTPREVQNLKIDAYKRINFDLSQGKASFAKNEAKASIAKAAKESLEKIDPSIKSTNKSMGDLIELNKELERVVSRLDNRNLISIDTPLKVAGGASVADEAGAAIGATASILGAPRVKARSALLLESIRKNSETIKILDNFAQRTPSTLTRQLLLQAGRLDETLKTIAESQPED